VIDHFRRFYNDSVSNGSTESLGLALRFFGSDHIMFGTDFPFGPEDGSWAVDELRAVRAMEISEADRERILHANLERLLGL
jgi:predicted TIM-barrel fold metal-dependent hydrolase